jgi:hypothetical protein
MNPQDTLGSNSNLHAAHDAEAALRVIANLPAPQGLEDRVLTGLRTAPRSTRVLSWPSAINPSGHWLRSVAAAAIVFVVIGGGWGVYKRVQPGTAIAAPQRAVPAAGFSNAGAVRVPQTVPVPPVQTGTVDAGQIAPAKTVRDVAVPSPPKQSKALRSAHAGKASAQPSVTVAK